MDPTRRYLNTEEAAAYIGISASTLSRMRVSGEGPCYSKAGRRVLYDVAQLDKWMEKRRRRFTGESTEED